jgi:hypothetical protein
MKPTVKLTDKNMPETFHIHNGLKQGNEISPFLVCGETESTWYAGHYLIYCTSPRWWMIMGVEQMVEWLIGEILVLGKTCPSDIL